MHGGLEVSLHPFLNSAWSDVICNFYTSVILPSRKELGGPLTVLEGMANGKFLPLPGSQLAGNRQTCNFACNWLHEYIYIYIYVCVCVCVYIYIIERPRVVKQTYICKWEKHASPALRVTFWRSTMFSKIAADETNILWNMGIEGPRRLLTFVIAVAVRPFVKYDK